MASFTNLGSLKWGDNQPKPFVAIEYFNSLEWFHGFNIVSGNLGKNYYNTVLPISNIARDSSCTSVNDKTTIASTNVDVKEYEFETWLKDQDFINTHLEAYLAKGANNGNDLLLDDVVKALSPIFVASLAQTAIHDMITAIKASASIKETTVTATDAKTLVQEALKNGSIYDMELEAYADSYPNLYIPYNYYKEYKHLPYSEKATNVSVYPSAALTGNETVMINPMNVIFSVGEDAGEVSIYDKKEECKTMLKGWGRVGINYISEKLISKTK